MGSAHNPWGWTQEEVLNAVERGTTSTRLLVELVTAIDEIERAWTADKADALEELFRRVRKHCGIASPNA